MVMVLLLLLYTSRKRPRNVPVILLFSKIRVLLQLVILKRTPTESDVPLPRILLPLTVILTTEPAVAFTYTAPYDILFTVEIIVLFSSNTSVKELPDKLMLILIVLILQLITDRLLVFELIAVLYPLIFKLTIFTFGAVILNSVPVLGPFMFTWPFEDMLTLLETFNPVIWL
ncbi:hypothetical protein MBCUT_01080 [Methanobrevibacter cuticularis]|uniref:Uncharacterized protein n=1 Tax=Methanobrevibacter cuticularis TaxID=47311 RepID=A0A166FIU9_9EURY|nr:hypothetical protein MBCUT_01080 [Methanobrevibacter cuticularis]